MRPARRRLVTGTVMAVLFIGTALVGTVTTAGALDTPACGATITTSITLGADVGPCNTTDGLIVRANNIVIDLNGYRIFSTAPLPRNIGTTTDPTECPSADTRGACYVPADKVGVKLLDSNNVVVRNGTIDRFTAGVSIENGSRNTIQSMTIQNNQGPCVGENFSTFAIGGYGDGVVIFGSPNNRILNNVIRNNGPFSGIAVVANTQFITRAVPPYPSGTVIQNNTIDSNNICFADIGIRLEGPGASNSVVTGNTVNRSFLEGIVVHPVNTIDFEPLFRNPPQCQNRGFPDPNLPACPIQNPLNPTNDNNVIQGNQVTNNGYGGPQAPAGPSRINNPSAQAATGLNLLSFCGYGARANATGNVVQSNTVTGNAGDGIRVGGCPLGQNPANGTFPGFTNSRIVQNTSVNNGGARCGTLPPTPGCGSRPTTPAFDLRDSTNEIVCPSTSGSVQSQCAALGFGPPPAGVPFVGTRVIQAGGTPCDNNIWYGNRYGTAFPPCTTNGGQQISSSPATAAESADSSSGTAASDGSAATSTDAVLPLRKR